jgi:hypothetical protein
MSGRVYNDSGDAAPPTNHTLSRVQRPTSVAGMRAKRITWGKQRNIVCVHMTLRSDRATLTLQDKTLFACGTSLDRLARQVL